MRVRACPSPWACLPWRAFWALALALALPFSPGVSLFRGGAFPPSHGRIPADGVPMRVVSNERFWEVSRLYKKMHSDLTHGAGE